jgi:hypothetical protein
MNQCAGRETVANRGETLDDSSSSTTAMGTFPQSSHLRPGRLVRDNGTLAVPSCLRKAAATWLFARVH